jgi:DNA-binding transcriptional ArsR family regulator
VTGSRNRPSQARHRPSQPLLVLAWVERNRALLLFGLVYLAIVGFGWITLPHSPWLFLVSTAAVLLLGILTITHEARRVEFGFLRTALELTAGNLGQHLSVLEKAELAHIEKGYEGKPPRTWVNLTPAGEKALRDEIAHLKRLIQQVEQATP